jgi:hypothetical protein
MEFDIRGYYDIKRQYGEALGKIRAAVDLEPDERRALADELYAVAKARQDAITEDHVSERQARIDTLTANVFKGDGEFKAAVTRHALAGPDDIRKLAALAKRTDNAELYRAAYVLAYESGDAALEHEIKRGDEVLAGKVDELDALTEQSRQRSPHAMYQAATARAVDSPGGPEFRELLPGREEMAAAQEQAEAERKAERARVVAEQAAIARSSVRKNADLPGKRRCA